MNKQRALYIMTQINEWEKQLKQYYKELEGTTIGEFTIIEYHEIIDAFHIYEGNTTNYLTPEEVLNLI